MWEKLNNDFKTVVRYLEKEIDIPKHDIAICASAKNTPEHIVHLVDRLRMVALQKTFYKGKQTYGNDKGKHVKDFKEKVLSGELYEEVRDPELASALVDLTWWRYEELW